VFNFESSVTRSKEKEGRREIEYIFLLLLIIFPFLSHFLHPTHCDNRLMNDPHCSIPQECTFFGMPNLVACGRTRASTNRCLHINSLVWTSYVQPGARMWPSRSFVRPGLGFVVKVSYVLTTSPYFDNLELDIFDAGDLQCNFITSVTIAVRIPTLSVH